MKQVKRGVLLGCILAILLLLSACSPGRDMEEFMALPRLPQEYLELQQVLDGLQAEGAASYGIQEAPRSWKCKETGFPFESPDSNAICWHLDFSSRRCVSHF